MTNGDAGFKAVAKMVANKEVVAVLGTGVSISVTDGNELAGWVGLLRNGVQKCEDQAQTGGNPLSDQWGNTMRNLLSGGDLTDLIGVASNIETRLRKHYHAYDSWLKDTVGSLAVKKPDLLDAIKELNVPCITTNYDTLADDHLKRRTTIWNQSFALHEFARNLGLDKLLHLHGVWNSSETVVLGSESYMKLVTHNDEQAIQSALGIRATLLLIGCGDGLEDPNFGPWLDSFKTVDADFKPYRLVTQEEYDKAQARKGDKTVHLLKYPGDHKKLPDYIRALAKAAHKPSGANAAASAISAKGHTRVPAENLAGQAEGLESVADRLLRSLLLPTIANTGVSAAAIAAEYYERAADLFEQIYDQDGAGRCHLGAGSAQIERARNDSVGPAVRSAALRAARASFERAHEIFEGRNDKRRLAKAWVGMATTAELEGDVREARRFWEDAALLYESVAESAERRKCLQALARLAEL